MRKKKFSVLNDQNIKMWWDQLETAELSPENFLNKAATDLLHGGKIKTVEEGTKIKTINM